MQNIIRFNESIFHGLNQQKSSWCNKSGMSEESLSEWKHLGNNELELKINILRIKHLKFKFDDIFTVSKIPLKYLYNKLIVTTNDQANRNLIEICKKC